MFDGVRVCNGPPLQASCPLASILVRGGQLTLEGAGVGQGWFFTPIVRGLHMKMACHLYFAAVSNEAVVRPRCAPLYSCVFAAGTYFCTLQRQSLRTRKARSSGVC